jgi:histidinol dehydrogenase
VIIIEDSAAARSALDRPLLAELESISPDTLERVRQLFGNDANPESAVQQIIREVRQDGDAAVCEYTLKIDRVELASLEVSRDIVSAAYNSISGDLVNALKNAAERIRRFHANQKREIWDRASRPDLGWVVRPLQRAGVYAPGGTASYPSSILMAAIPARVAGVEEVVVVTPPGRDGEIPPATLAAADIAGVDRIFRIGGAQAIAALAFGTESVPKVDKICGPGNIFVVLAKKMVYGYVDIDGLHGPSEVVIIADGTTNPQYCIDELLAQAEHDTMAASILITPSRDLAEEVNRQVEIQARDLPRCNLISESLQNQGMIVVTRNLDEAIELTNLYAPEHLHLMMPNAEKVVERIQNAGTVFLGERSTVVLGDYVAGPSHVLPTGGTARFSSPLNTGSFFKVINLVNIDPAELKSLSRSASLIARSEGLQAHARAVERWLR